jgi:hypothetical protein
MKVILMILLLTGCTGTEKVETRTLYCVGMCALNEVNHENTTSDNLTDEQRDNIGRLLDQDKRTSDIHP